MSDETVDLGRRLRLAGVPLKLPGALVIQGDGNRGRWIDGLDLRSEQASTGFMLFADESGFNCIGDIKEGPATRLELSDGATRGAVLEWLRQAYGQFNLCPRFMNMGSTTLSWWCFSLNLESLDDLPHGDSEAEALVVAAEWLREGRWSARHPRKKWP